MKVLTEGHRYELSSFEGGEPQVIQFIEKVPVAQFKPSIGELEKILQSGEKPDIEILPNGGIRAKEEGALVTINDGTTNEEVIKVLLHRLNYLQDKFPCNENSQAIDYLEMAYSKLQLRTLRREVQNVEGKQLEHKNNT